MGLHFAPEADEPMRRALGYASAADALLDCRGWTVRCTPRRRTVADSLPGGITVYRKFYDGSGAQREWARLGRLGELGFAVPTRVCLAASPGRSVIVCAAAPGRALDALLRDAVGSGGSAVDEAVRYCVDVVAPTIRRLHDCGLYYRDLYWNHLYAIPRAGEPPCFIDVERVFRPRWRRRRWQAKDLAGLLSSAPGGLPATAALRFFRSYRGRSSAPWKPLARAVQGKACRIRRHRPKYG